MALILVERNINHVKRVLGIQADEAPDFENKMGQWFTLVWQDVAIVRVNLRFSSGKLPTLVFSAYVAKSGENYDAFLEIKEPELAIPTPRDLTYVDADGSAEPDQRIAGIICQEGPRFSFSNPSAPAYTLDDDGMLTIGDQTWYLHTLQMPDARRVVNYNAFFGRQPVAQVRIAELGELEMYQD